MSSTKNIDPLMEEQEHEFCGHTLKLAMFKGASLGVSAYIWGPLHSRGLEIAVGGYRSAESALGLTRNLYAINTFMDTKGLVLCQYFQDQKFDFTGKKVLELGSGTGIVGILTVLLGGDVTMTDRPKILQQIEYNVKANIPATARDRSKINALVWGADQNKFPTDYDIILGSDIVYSPSQFSGLIQTLQYFCRDNTIIYMSSNLNARMGAYDFHNELIPKLFNSEFLHQSGGDCIYKVTKKTSQEPSTCI